MNGEKLEAFAKDIRKRLQREMPMGMDVWRMNARQWAGDMALVVMDPQSNTIAARLVFRSSPEPAPSEHDVERMCDAVIMRAAQSAALYRYCKPALYPGRR